MNSPKGSARTPARLDRSISPQPLDHDFETRHDGSSASHEDIEGYPMSRQTSVDVVSSCFTKLPSKVIDKILWCADANSFASLCMVNKEWWQEAQKVELYAHHLSRCPSYALSNSIITGPFRKHDLYRLRVKFATEVRRNLFDAYTRPRRTNINLVSINANSSAAFPTGEAFRFEFSPNGRTILALSSSRVYVLDATSDPIVVKRQLKTSRRALSASVTDDGSLLAVLSSRHQVNIYALTDQDVQHLQVIVLDNPPKIIAITHEGTVLAASYEAGIEVFSLAANSLTTDRRAVRSEAVDVLSFSGDGSMLIGTSLSLDEPNAVVISAPFYTENDPDLSPREMHSRMWTTQILFPQISSVCSHVALLPGHLEGDACWLFAFDHSLMSYRAVRTDDTRSGVAYFLSPPGADRFDTPIPTIPPSATACGTLVVAGFEGDGLWLYGIPERLDLSPDMGAVVERNERRVRAQIPLTSATGHAEPLMAYSPSTSASDYSIEDDSLASKVDWRQSLFVKCESMSGLPGQTAARWVEHVDNGTTHANKRLIVVAPGGVSHAENEIGDESMPVDGSRMCVLDFQYGPSMLPDRTITIEVGEGEAELLTEHSGSLAAEVALERRRTIRAIPTSDNPRMPLGRSITSISPPSSTLLEDGFRKGSVSSPSSPTEQSRSPRLYATNSLQRSVTASGFRHALYPPRPPLGSQNIEAAQFQHPRQGYYGRPASQDSWETPPPPYTGANSPARIMQQASHNSTFNQQRLSGAPSRSTPPAPAAVITQPFYQPYRPPGTTRSSSTLDAIMTSDAMPPNGNMSQYAEMMLAAASQGQSESSIDANADDAAHVAHGRPSRPATRTSYASPSPSDISRPARPMTHHGSMSPNWLASNRSFTSPLLPSTPNEILMPIDESDQGDQVKPSTTNGLSLTGANLQNRLNHPVPPVPNELLPPESIEPTRSIETARSDMKQFHRSGGDTDYPLLPTPDQMANLQRRVSQSEMRRPPAIVNTNFRHQSNMGNVPPSPPRAAWGATGIPGSPNFHQARNVPDGYLRSRSSSRGSQTSQLASASAPNLLAQRPKYGRLDTIDSINDVHGIGDTGHGVRSRSHSMTQVTVPATAEPSAYHETSTFGPVLAGTKYGKKGKKKKEESVKKSSRCSVM